MTRPVRRREAAIVDALESELKAHGFTVHREVSLNDNDSVCRVDLVACRWDEVFGIEVKRPEADLTGAVFQAKKYTDAGICDARFPQWRGLKLPAVLLYPNNWRDWRVAGRVVLKTYRLGLLRPCVEHAGLVIGWGEIEVPLRNTEAVQKDFTLLPTGGR